MLGLGFYGVGFRVSKRKIGRIRFRIEIDTKCQVCHCYMALNSNMGLVIWTFKENLGGLLMDGGFIVFLLGIYELKEGHVALNEKGRGQLTLAPSNFYPNLQFIPTL
jgi:hypothetical protein